MTNIPWDQLTATFRDAITICRRLGIFYLWIDSLCIIQDSKDDWKDQASKMTGIYENSFITIAATKSRNSSEGCFTECDQKYLAKSVPGYPNHYVRQLPPSFPSHWNMGELDRSPDWPLLNRAWIYQEMRLSQRVLHFCAQEVVWQCPTVQLSESGSNDKDLSDDGEFGNMQHQGVPYSVLQKSPRYLWYRTVQDYSRLEMTFESDKMPALAGLATRMETMRHGDRYLAGLWEKTLLFDLLWFVEPTPVPGKPRNSRFPSWNWASVNSQVTWSENVDSTLTSVKVEEVRFVATGPSHLGEFSEATVTIQAPLIDASLLAFNRRHAPGDVSHNGLTLEQLYLHDYKVDSLPHDSPPGRFEPDPSGFIVPIGVSTANHVCVAVHVQLRPGSTYHERVGYIGMNHPSLHRQFEAIQNGDSDLHARIRKDAVRMKEMLESLPTSRIVLV